MRKSDHDKAKAKDLAAREKVKQSNLDYLESNIEVRARLGGICRQTFEIMVKTGRFSKPVRIGSRCFWKSSTTTAYLAAMEPISA